MDSDEDNAAVTDEEDEPERKKKEKKKKEEKQYKSAQFIEDSDEEYGDMDGFLEREKVMRERIKAAAGDGRIGTMKPTGTKKRRRKGKDSAANKKPKGDWGSDDPDQDPHRQAEEGTASSASDNSGTESDSDEGVRGADAGPAPAAPRPRPRPLAKRVSPSPGPPLPATESPATLSSSDSLRRADTGEEVALAKDKEGRSASVDNTEEVVRASVKKNRAHLVISDEDE